MDGISGPIPFHIAKAYGVRAAVEPTRLASAPLKSIAATGSLDAGVVRPAFPQDRFASRLDTMVSGSVDSPIGRGEGFDAPSSAVATNPRASAGDRFRMYSRAADAVEVSTAVTLGRQIDTLA